MRYALIGDIHSSNDDLQAVLTQIQDEATDAKIIGTGDLFECTISKKDITDDKYSNLKDVLVNENHFSKYLTFPSVAGNQEERILHITKTEDPLRNWIATIPETMELEGATVIHGHQWTWGGEPWSLQHAQIDERLVFYGHSHTSGIFYNGVPHPIVFNEWMDVKQGTVLVNVGSVIDNREWVLYDSSLEKVMFKKA